MLVCVCVYLSSPGSEVFCVNTHSHIEDFEHSEDVLALKNCDKCSIIASLDATEISKLLGLILG